MASSRWRWTDTARSKVTLEKPRDWLKVKVIELRKEMAATVVVVEGEED